MQKSKMAILGMTALIALIPSMAFAATSDDLEIGISLGEEGIRNAVAGATAGIFLSTIAVLAKHIRNEADKKPDPKRYGLNIVIGAFSALIVGFIPGINGLVGNDITFAVAFALLYVVDQIIRPVYGNWAKGEKASAKTS